MLNAYKRKILGVALGAALLATGCESSTGVNTKIDGVDGPNVSYVNGYVTVSMVFKNVEIEGGATIPVPKYPNSSFQIGPNFQGGGTLISITVNGNDWLGNQGQGLNPQTLPGGRPLPGVSSGALPAVALVVPQLNNSVLYFGPSVIGFFVPFKIDTNAIVTFKFYNSSGNRIGNLSLVGYDANKANSGILALMDPALLGIKGLAARDAALRRYYLNGIR